jgi:hypothetical protein
MVRTSLAVEIWCIAFVSCFDERLPMVMTRPQLANLWQPALRRSHRKSPRELKQTRARPPQESLRQVHS